jgi:thiol:disulfide interchange protein DsbD
VTARLISESAALAPGSTATLGVSLTIEKGWHVYWNGLNETGVPISATFDLPEGFKAAPMQWPAPVRYIADGDLLDHVYFDKVTLLVPVEVPATAKPGSTVPLKAKVNWLVCKDTCVPESADVTLTIPIAAADAPPQRSPDADLIQASRARLPRPLKDAPGGAGVKVTWTPNAVTIDVPGAQALAFYPYDTSVTPANLIRDGERRGESLTISIDANSAVRNLLDGVLEVRGKDNKPTAFYRLNEQRLPALGALHVPREPGPGAFPTPPNGAYIPTLADIDPDAAKAEAPAALPAPGDPKP